MAFASAVILLCLSGLATYLTIVRLMESEKWRVHTYEVQAALGTETPISRALLKRLFPLAVGSLIAYQPIGVMMQ